VEPGGTVPTDAITSIVSFLLQLGLPGVCIMALSFFAYKKDNRADELQDEFNKQMRDITITISNLTNAIQANNTTLSSLKDFLLSRGKSE